MKGTKVTPENLQSKIGYGHGTTVGYSEDGVVFMTVDVKGPNGEPMQTMLQWPHDIALGVSASIAKAAEAAKKEAESNGRSDSNRVN